MAGICERECMGRGLGVEPLTLTKCHSFMKPWKGGNPSVAKSQLKSIKGKISFFISWHDACRPRFGGNWLKYNDK